MAQNSPFIYDEFGNVVGTNAGYTPTTYGNEQMQSVQPAPPTNPITGLPLPQAAPTLLGNVTGLGAGPVAGIALGTALTGMGLYNAFKGKKGDPASRAQTAVVTGGLSEVARPIMGRGLFKSGKSGDQQGRDKARGLAVGAGLADKDFNVSLADGSKYNIGKDGSVKNYNVDFKRAGAGDAVGNVQGLAHIIGAGLNEKARRDLTGELANAALSKGDAKANALALYQNAGFDTKDKAFAAIQQLQDQGQIDQERGNIYRNAANNLYGNPPPQRRR